MYTLCLDTAMYATSHCHFVLNMQQVCNEANSGQLSIFKQCSLVSASLLQKDWECRNEGQVQQDEWPAGAGNPCLLVHASTAACIVPAPAAPAVWHEMILVTLIGLKDIQPRHHYCHSVARHCYKHFKHGL